MSQFQVQVEPQKKQSLTDTHWKGPYHCWVPKHIAEVPAADGRNTLYRDGNGLATALFVGDPYTEERWRTEFAYQRREDGRWFYNEAQPRCRETCAIMCTRCQDGHGAEVCSRCQYTHYCGAECQKADWARHKRECYKLPRGLNVNDPQNRALYEALQVCTLFNTVRKSSRVKDATELWRARTTFLSGVVGRVLDNPVDASVRDEHLALVANTQLYDGLCGIAMHAPRWSVYRGERSEREFWSQYLWPYVPLQLHREVATLYQSIKTM